MISCVTYFVIGSHYVSAVLASWTNSISKGNWTDVSTSLKNSWKVPSEILEMFSGNFISHDVRAFKLKLK